jgi:hypothetical protein
VISVTPDVLLLVKEALVTTGQETVVGGRVPQRQSGCNGCFRSQIIFIKPIAILVLIAEKHMFFY